MKCILFLVMAGIPYYLFGQDDLRQSQKELIGTTVKEISFTDYLKNEPADKNFNSKFKVLEFWATWCRPCLAAVPHINKLQAKFKDEDILFISVTAEAPEKTVKTLQKVNFETIVVSDQTRTIHRDLRIEYKNTMAIPRTVLIDNENKIVWYGSPKDLTPSLLKKFLNKEPL